MSRKIDDLRKMMLSCVILVAVYVVLASQIIWLPGIYYDEVLQAVPAIATIKDVHGPYIQVNGTVVDLANHPFPLMILPYLGATQAAILAPVFALTSISVPIMRYTFIILGVIALIITFFFTHRLFDSITAFLASFLLAIDPTYIFSTRSDNGPTTIMMICKMGALWLFLSWWQSRRPGYLLGGAFLVGLGLYDKVNFIWFVGALAIAIMFLYQHLIWELIRQSKWYIWVGATLSFFVGGVPLWIYTIFSGGGAFRGLLRIFSHETSFGTDNTNMWFNLIVRLKSMFDLLAGYEILTFYTSTFGDYAYPYSRGYFPTTAIPWLFGVAIIVALLQSLFRKNWGVEIKKVLFLFLLTALVVIFSVVTPTNLMYHHLLVAYPFPHLVVAHFLVKIPLIISNWRLKISNRFAVWSVSGTIVIVTIVMSLGVTCNYYRVLQETGGIGMWSDSIYVLADYLMEDDRTVVVMDWGINLNLLVLSEGKLHIIEPWEQFIYTRDYSVEMDALVTAPNRLFVFHAPKYTGIYALTDEDGPRITFFKTIEALGFEPVLEYEIVQRNGDVLFELYTVSP